MRTRVLWNEVSLPRLRIAQVAPPLEAIPPQLYGGTERVIDLLTETLVERGHDVTLFAPGDSTTSARLVPTVEEALWHRAPAYDDFSPGWSITVGKLARDLDQFDLIHSHIDHFGFPLARRTRSPFVTTMHYRVDLPHSRELLEEFADVALVSVSAAQQLGFTNARWIATVHNGIRLTDFTPRLTAGEYLAFLGRISPEKGVDIAIRVARRVGMPLRIAARPPLPETHYPEARRDHEYFQEVVVPELRGGQVELIGEVSGADKDSFLGGAAALVFPVRWPEPFGLVMAEAMACGTPVLALRCGSTPEVVDDGVSGFVCADEDELVAAARRIDTLCRARCREQAERRFSAERMVDSYERVYEMLIANQERNPQGPTLVCR